MVMLAKFLSALGFSLLLGRIVSRWVHGPAWSKLPLSWPIAGLLLLLLGAGLEIGATLSALGFTAPADFADYLTATTQGKAALARVLGGVLLLTAETNAAAWVLGPLGLLVTALGFGCAGHAGQQGLFWALLDSLHALAAATWVGGLLSLGAQKPNGTQTQNFSAVASACVAVLLLGGLAGALRHLPAGAWWPALVGSQWGLVLLGKLGLITLALLLALAVRSRLLTPQSRVSQRAKRQQVAAPQATGWLTAEILTLLGVLGLSGALSSSPLPSTVQVAAQTFPIDVTLGNQHLTGELQLQGHGEVEVRLLPALEGLQARFNMSDHPMPPQTLPLQCNAAQCEGQTQLWMSGGWNLELTQGGETIKVPFRY